MELVNQTGVPAALLMSDRGVRADGGRVRTGAIVAKATYDVAPDGTLALTSRLPIPIFQMEQETELGILPRDLVPRSDTRVEVLLVGAAYAPRGQPAPRCTVELTIGSVERSLLVTGHREWSSGHQPRITDPVPFQRMPLTWAQAMGGSAEVWIDEKSRIEVSDSLNRYGTGFDLERHLQLLRTAWQCPDGYPRATSYVRPLPNIEHPQHQITRRQDTPLPYCWAPMPLDLGLRLASARAGLESGALAPEDPERGLEPQHYALPDLRFDTPAPGTTILLDGCQPEGRWSFRWPSMRVLVDYVAGRRSGVRELSPFMAVLLPEERRFTISYHHWFRMSVGSPDEERSFRLQVVG